MIFDPAQITLLIYDMVRPYVLGKSTHSSASIVIENLFTLRKDTKTAQLDPTVHLSCVPLVSLMLEPVSGLKVYRNATLVLRFGNGYEIEVGIGSPFELWNSQGTGMLSDMNMLARSFECPWDS